VNITPEQFNKAFAEFQLFGPRRRIPIEERWHEVLPSIDPLEFASLKENFKEIEGFALRLAEQVRHKIISDEVAQKELAQKYPILNSERLDHTWNQAMYFSFN
jgi:hypothetical protein